MHILIIGAAGMVGRKLTAGLVKAGQVGGKEIAKLTLADVIQPEPVPHAGAVETIAADLSAPGTAKALIASRPDLIFHLAAIVSGEAEADFEKGYRINLDGSALCCSKRSGWRASPALFPEARLHLFDRRVRCAVPRSDRRRVLLHPADQLRHAEGDHGIAPQRLFPAGVRRRHRHPAAHHRGPPGQAEHGGFGVLLQHPARAALRAGSGAAGQPRRAALVRQPARRGRIPAACRRTRLASLGLATDALGAGPVGHGGRGDRGIAACRRRQGGQTHPRGAGREDHRDRCRLAAQFRHAPRNSLGFRAETSFDEIIRIHIEDELGGRIAG